MKSNISRIFFPSCAPSLLLVWMVIIAFNTCESASVDIWKTITCQYNHPELFNYKFNGSLTDLKNGSVQCRIRQSPRESSSYSLSCMALFNVSDSPATDQPVVSIQAQTCWLSEKGQSDPCHDKSECSRRKSKANMLFCCCDVDNCNRKENIVTLEPAPEFTTLPPADDGENDKTVMAVISSAIAGLVVLCVTGLVIFYCIRKKSASSVPIDLQMKLDHYNFEMRISDEPPVVNYDDLELKQCLHKGRFGEVYLARMNDRDVCVKYFHSQQRPLFNNEKDVYSVLQPMESSIVQCLACDERTHVDDTIQYIVIMEYLELGSLTSYLKNRLISWSELCSMAQSVCAGLGYLHNETYINGIHKHAIVHRDVNSRNILVRPNWTCALADMGFALKIRGSKFLRNGIEEHAEEASIRDVGTLRYMAPEILDGAVNLRDCESSLKQIDVYALALVLWELVTRCADLSIGPAETKVYMLPFEKELGLHPTFDKVQKHVSKDRKRPEFPMDLKKNENTETLIETIKECWDTDAEARLTAQCAEERFKELDTAFEQKNVPSMSINDTFCKKPFSPDTMPPEMVPLMGHETPAVEVQPMIETSTKPDVNIEMEQLRLLEPEQGRNVMVERNTLREDSAEEMAVHDNTLISREEATLRQQAEQERHRRQWEDSMRENETPSQNRNNTTRSPVSNFHLDVHNIVNDGSRKMKENNIQNARRHNSQQSLTEATGSGVAAMISAEDRPLRPKSLNINTNGR